MTARALVVRVALSSCAFGCVQAPPNGGASPQGPLEIARLHVQKCGRCHTPPEPRSRTRDHLEAAFVRHKTRVRLTSEQWAAMVDYLAVPDASGASKAH